MVDRRGGGTQGSRSRVRAISRTQRWCSSMTRLTGATASSRVSTSITARRPPRARQRLRLLHGTLYTFMFYTGTGRWTRAGPRRSAAILPCRRRGVRAPCRTNVLDLRPPREAQALRNNSGGPSNASSVRVPEPDSPRQRADPRALCAHPTTHRPSLLTRHHATTRRPSSPRVYRQRHRPSRSTGRRCRRSTHHPARRRSPSARRSLYRRRHRRQRRRERDERRRPHQGAHRAPSRVSTRAASSNTTGARSSRSTCPWTPDHCGRERRELGPRAAPRLRDVQRGADRQLRDGGVSRRPRRARRRTGPRPRRARRALDPRSA